MNLLMWELFLRFETLILWTTIVFLSKTEETILVTIED